MQMGGDNRLDRF